MLRPSRAWRLAPPLLLLLLAGSQAGCTLTWLYERADWLIIRRIDSYLDLTPAQKELAYGAVRGHLKWHRKHALPAYERLLTEARTRLADGMDKRDLAWTEEAVRGQVRAVVKRVIPDVATLLGQLSPEQLTHAETQLTDERKDAGEDDARPLDERLGDRARRTVALVEDWVGPLDESQEAMITRMSRELPYEAPALSAKRAARQDELLGLLRNGETKDLPRRLRGWLLEDPVLPSASWREGMRRMVLAVDASLTGDQRHALLLRIDGLVQQVRRMRGGR